MNIKNLLMLVIINTLFFAQNVFAEDNLSIGIKLLGSTWSGDNGAGGSSFESTEGSQIAFSVSYKKNDFYTGLSIQAGGYTFNNGAPDQFTPAGRVTVTNEEITQGELDLLIGYYFWPRVSLFLDIKGVGNNWVNSNSVQDFSGLGLGVATHYPLTDSWTIFGSLGFVPGDIKNNSTIVGDGSYGALELGGIYAFDESNYISTGFKLRNYDFSFMDGTDQTYSINGLFVGYIHNFSL